jgi:integrase
MASYQRWSLLLCGHLWRLLEVAIYGHLPGPGSIPPETHPARDDAEILLGPPKRLVRNAVGVGGPKDALRIERSTSKQFLEEGAGGLARTRTPEGDHQLVGCLVGLLAPGDPGGIAHDLNVGGYMDPRAGRMTVHDYGEQWRRSQLHHAVSTARDVEGTLRVHLYPALGERPIGSIRPSDTQAWVASLARTLGPAAMTKTYSFFATMMKAAVRDGLIAKTPCIDIHLPKVEKKRVVPLTVEQVGKLLEAVPEHYRPLIHFFAGTGARAREAFGVTVDRLDFLRRQFTIDRQLATRDGSAAWKAPKTPASVRTVPLDDGVLEVVGRHLEAHPVAANGLIFTTPEGKALDVSQAYGGARRLRWFRKAAREAGLSDEITLHDLRHFYASLLIRNGANVKLVQARLGHKSATETLDTYGHLWPDSDEQTRNILNEALLGLRKGDSKLRVLDKT